ncbi:hypothetical protein A3BBH6_10690 [Alistipes onderdonkii subsp. vulgaris]|uniref:DUF4906 domain-containing protein n=1 Tax=Alistipes onderdonkii TaxID=328813 RepID=UPI00114152BD|nr:DUF4906 domain-containing protein [Alistipes onderdonkii]BBL00833.1 hypothetical protein A3BBH6_10690 [Alistipes onderdonkii subsp. vulgaris]
MKRLKHFSYIALISLLLTGCEQYSDIAGHDRGKLSVTLEIEPETPVSLTRAVSENGIEDVNIFIYRNGSLVEHTYAAGTSHKIDIAPGTYSLYVVANMHRDMGDLSESNLQVYSIAAPTDGTLTMIGTDTFTIDGSRQVLPISLKRHAAKIAYNITVDPAAGDIEISSIQLCSIPDREYLITDLMGPTDPATGFHDSEIRKFPNGSKSANGIFYMLSNRQGDVSSIASQDQKNPDKAPKYASYLCIRGRSGENKVVDFVVYLGSNMTTNFDVLPNEAHTYNITILSDSETDTRITSYLFEFYSSWPRSPYCIPGDYGEFSVRNGNRSDHTFTGQLEVTQGDAASFRYGDGGAWYEGALHDVYIPAKSDARGDMEYTPALIKKGVNQTLAYRLTITDEQGEAIRFEASQEFANMVRANFQAGTGSVTVSGELAKAAGTNYVLAYCYEDGCTFTAVDGNGYAFDGWYADQAYTQLLSAAAAYKHAPTKGQDAIYARFALVKQPKVEISCNQQNKNSTYMYNKNTVTMTVTDFSGPITIKATCAAGGLFTSATSFTKNVVSGQSFTLDPIVFVPTAVGDVSYTIDVATSTGIKIGSKTVTNNIVATKLTPSISISYDSNTRQMSYKPAYTSTYVYWYGYKTVIARVAFTPALDYPAPIESAQLLKIQLYPTFRAYEITGAEDTSSGQWAPVERTINSPSISGHEFAAINTTYADAQGISYTLTSVNNMSGLDAKNPLLAPYTEGDTMLLLPFTESEAIAAKMTDRTFIKYFFNKPTLLPSQISVSNSYPKNDLQIVTDIKLINITNNL